MKGYYLYLYLRKEMLKSDHLFAQQLYFMLKIESTFNRIETLGQFILSFLIEIFVKEFFLYCNRFDLDSIKEKCQSQSLTTWKHF